MSIGTYLQRVRHRRQLSLRDVQQLAKDKRLGAEISSGYLSMLERDEVKEPSPRILYTLAAIYELDYIELMREAGYMPGKDVMEQASPAFVAFRGAARLTEEQQDRVQRMIDFELSESRRAKREGKLKSTDG